MEHHLFLLLEVLREHGQLTYKLCKMWPSLVIGAILRDLEGSPSFLHTITEDVAWSLKRTRLYSTLIGTVTCAQNAMMRLELAGLWKTMGHPVIDMNKSTANWCRKGTTMKLGLREPANKSIICLKSSSAANTIKRTKGGPTSR